MIIHMGYLASLGIRYCANIESISIYNNAFITIIAQLECRFMYVSKIAGLSVENFINLLFNSLLSQFIRIES